jgi:hemoglobin
VSEREPEGSSPVEGITEDSISRLIHHFYSKVRRDPILAAVFDAAIATDEWPDHLATMQRFWSSVMLTSGRYSGNPVEVHRALRGLERSMFPRWLELFEQSARALFTPETAVAFVRKAQRIADSLQLAVFHRLGGPPEGLRLPPRRRRGSSVGSSACG